MESRMYPHGSGGVKARYDEATGILHFYNSSGAIVYSMDPTLKHVHGGGVVNFVRARFTVSEINAGATLVAAKPGLKIKMVDAAMIAVGGAAGTATTVDILATAAAASRKLLAVAIAALTQSALVRAGAANSSLLADGASHTANDANTAVTVAVTGSALDTCTHVDFLFWYVAEE